MAAPASGSQPRSSQVEYWTDSDAVEDEVDMEQISVIDPRSHNDNQPVSFDSRTRETLFPIKSVADRVAMQVEEFAIQVDEWLLTTDGDIDNVAYKYEQTVQLADSLKTITKTWADQMKVDAIRTQKGKTPVYRSSEGHDS
jgi:hypothetical protein